MCAYSVYVIHPINATKQGFWKHLLFAIVMKIHRGTDNADGDDQKDTELSHG